MLFDVPGIRMSRQGRFFEVSLRGPSMLFDVPGQELADEGACLSSRGYVLLCSSFR
jgi:hypothetical protein